MKLQIFPFKEPRKATQRVGIELLQEGSDVIAILVDETGQPIDRKPQLLRFKVSKTTGKIYVSRADWVNSDFVTIDTGSRDERMKMF